MASFEEMIIQGIRSYPPTTQSVIRFLHPLTIIQGNNGCGKTTIIEALNNICTGALPSGQKATFLHDLENAKTQKVDALIKLRFRDVRNREIVACTRMTSLVGKEGKTQTRADEQTIKVYPNGGERGIAISSKTIDFKLEMLNLLGIPKAIMENVVFCHQENSTWPLSEPKLLKSKFDDIFQLTGFVKFVDKGKTKLKELKDKYALALAEHSGALAIQNEKQTAVTRLETQQAELKQAAERQRTVQKEMHDLTKALREGAEQLRTLQAAAYQRNVVEAKLDGLRKQRSMLNVPEWSGSEQELREAIREIESTREYQSASEQKAALERKLREMDKEAEQVKAERGRAEAEMTQVAAREMHRNSTATALRELTKSLATEFTLRADVGMQQQLEMLAEEWRADGERRVRSLAAAETELRAALERASDARRTLQLEHKNLSETLRKLRAEAEETERRLSAISSSQNEVPELRNQIGVLERLLAEKAEPAPSEEEQRGMEENKKQLGEKITTLRESIKAATQWEEIGKDRERRRTDKAAEERARDALLQKHNDDFMLLFNRVIREDSIGEKIEYIYKQAQRQLDEERTAVRNAEITLDRAQNLVLTKQSEQRSLQDEKMELQEKIVQVTGDADIDPDDVDWRLEQTMASVQSFRKELAPLEASATLYAKWEEETKENKCCPLCDRGFSRGDEKGVAKLAQKLHDLSISIPRESEELAARLKEEEEDERKLGQAKNYAEQMRTVTSKWLAIKAEVKTAEVDVEVHRSALGKVRDSLALTTQRAEAVNRIKGDASLMDSHLKAAQKLAAQLMQGEAEWEKKGAPAVQQRQQEEQRLRAAEEELESINARLDEAQRAASEVNRITREMHELRERILRLDEDVVQRAGIEERLQKCYDELRQAEARARQIEQEGPERDRECEAARGALQTAERATRAAESEAAAALNKISERRDRLVRATEELDRLSKSAGDVESCRATLASCDVRLDQLRKRKTECEMDVTRVGEAQDKRRLLNDQLMLIENRRGMAECESELQKLSGSAQDVKAAEVSCARMEQKKNDLLRAQGELEGKKKAVQDEVDDLEARLRSEGMRAADEKFLRALTKKMVYGHGVSDLSQYIDAVDRSMLDFHKEKMGNINRIIDELWRMCYNGGDIESIRIMSEQTTETEGKKKSYNYKVLMQFTSGAEVDMRDRCSAGQKMLACLIIRLALADTFGQSCATIALDEPTTNLDKDKVDAMAEMLGELIKLRSSKENLEKGGRGIQMLVITHDRRFVEKLALFVKPEYVYEVTKDGSDALSAIQRVYTSGHKEAAGPSQVLQQDEREWMGGGGRKRTTTAAAAAAAATRKRKERQYEEEEDED